MTKPAVERIGILETKVENLEGKIDDLKETVKANDHDLKAQLKTMYEASCAQHEQLSRDIKEIKNAKDKILITAAVIGPIVAFFAAFIDWHTVFANAIK